MIIDPLGIVPIERGGTGATTLKEAKEKLGGGGTVLFSSESGTTDTTITLSDDISNYKYVEVYHQGSTNYQTTDGPELESIHCSKGIVNNGIANLLKLSNVFRFYYSNAVTNPTETGLIYENNYSIQYFYSKLNLSNNICQYEWTIKKETDRGPKMYDSSAEIYKYCKIYAIVGYK